MKSFARIATIATAAAICLATISIPAYAQSTLTDEQRDRIKANCLSIKNTLTQLRASDALLRINRGQVYEAMGTKLMDRFNARLGGNAFDARGLTTLTKGYDDRLALFRVHYEDYARQLGDVIKIDCTKDPDAFHLAVGNARTKRQVLHEDVLRLHTYIDDYRSSVNDFRTDFEQLSEDNS